MIRKGESAVMEIHMIRFIENSWGWGEHLLDVKTEVCQISLEEWGA